VRRGELCPPDALLSALWCRQNRIVVTQRRQFLLDIGQVFTSPKEFAVDDEARHAKDAGGFRRLADRIVFKPAGTRQITAKTATLGMNFR
jgi:hypothetical protein